MIIINVKENLIAYARENANGASIRETFLSMDCHAFAFLDERFDIVVCETLDKSPISCGGKKHACQLCYKPNSARIFGAPALFPLSQ